MTDIQFDGFEDYVTDENLETGAGVALEYDEGRTIFIHRAGGSNKKFSRALEAKMKPHRRKIQLGTLDPEIDRRILMEAYAEAVVIGWSGITAGGKELPFNKENCIAFFKAFPEVFADVQRSANDVALFRKEVRGADEKNSGASSAGGKKPAAGDQKESNGS